MQIRPSAIGQSVHPSLLRLLFAFLVNVIALEFQSLPCAADTAPRENPRKPKIVLDAGMQGDAEAAIVVVERFLGIWEQRKHDQASALVSEPVRKQAEQELRRRQIQLISLDDIRLYMHKGVLLARVHVSVVPSPDRKDLVKEEIGIDMIFLNQRATRISTRRSSRVAIGVAIVPYCQILDSSHNLRISR